MAPLERLVARRARHINVVPLQEESMETSTEEIVTVLFLADDLDVAEWYRVKLELDGYQVRIVPRTPRPINLDECVAPDLLVLDVKPDQGDTVAFSKVRSHPRRKDVPAILLSSQRPDK